MRKRVWTAVVAGGAAVGALALKDENRRHKLKTQFNQLKEKCFSQDRHLIEQAGKPEEHSHHEDAKMVSEGSQFGVQYYNELKEEKEKAH
ncbi:hypothetical protein [Piscibacillus halophilus]|uniref:hypothetical protein n=1 Tax=Piscibacillus halophilus TaxID=571933 RepID=UPI001FE5A598|nr:hypothetical protein [Piscibacillus halophilus]